MSVIRYPVYVWSDGLRMNLWARCDADDRGVMDPLYGRTEGSEDYPEFVSGVAMDLDVWDEIVEAYLAQRDRGVYRASGGAA